MIKHTEDVITEISVSNLPKRKVCIGHQGENEFRQVTFDVTDWKAFYPNGEIIISLKRPDGVFYPVLTGATEDRVVYRPSGTDTAVVGDGWIEVRLVDGNIVGKSCKIPVVIESALGETGDIPENKAVDWIGEIIKTVDDAKNIVKAANTTAENLQEEIAEAQNLLGESTCELEGEVQQDGVVLIKHKESQHLYRPAILYTSQDLTREQKLQARDNIGAGTAHCYIDKSDGWAVSIVDDEFVNASLPIGKSNFRWLSDEEAASLGFKPGVYCTERAYIELPCPMRYINLAGTVDRGGLYISSVNGVAGDASIGAYFRVFSPARRDEDSEYLVMRIMTMGARKDPPAEPSVAYYKPIADKMIACAQSYIAARNAGRKFVYGANILYAESETKPRGSNGRINDPHGRAIMECDTFVGMILRGIDYAHSPYSPDYTTHTSCDWYFDTTDLTGGDGGTWKQKNANNTKMLYSSISLEAPNDMYDSFPSASSDGWHKIKSEQDLYVAYSYNNGASWTNAGPIHPASNDKNAELDKRIIGVADDNGFKTGYQQFMEDTALTSYWDGTDYGEMPKWIAALRERIRSVVANACYGRDLKYACDYSWMFWWIKGAVFSNREAVRPGDVAIFRSGYKSRWFDNISHVAFIGPYVDEEESDLYVYEVTGASASNGKYLNDTTLSEISNRLAYSQGSVYFARPYYKCKITTEDISKWYVADPEAEGIEGHYSCDVVDCSDEECTFEHIQINEENSIWAGNELHLLLTPESGYRLRRVEITMYGHDVTSDVYNNATGEITIPCVSGNVVISVASIPTT